LVGSASFPTTRAGYRQLLGWMHTFGILARVGVEGTGSYGAGICRQLTAAGVEVVEVNRPDRSQRRRRGKSDVLDAAAAAEAARTGNRIAIPKSRDGQVESLRVLRLTRASAVKARTKAFQQLDQLIVTAPERLRDQLRDLPKMRLIGSCAAWRPHSTDAADPTVAARIALKSLARRYLRLDAEITELDQLLEPFVADLAAQLVAVRGVGTETAGQILVTVGDKSPPGAQRGRLCDVVRGGAVASLFRQNPAASAQPRRGPASQPGHPCHRHHPETLRSPHPGVYGEEDR
jgi:transposase